MKYTVQSSKYALKNFIYLFPLAIIPAYFLSLSTDQDAVYCALEAVFTGNRENFHFSHIFQAISILNFDAWDTVLFGLIAIVSLIVCGSMILAMLDKHMRIGKRTFTGIFSKLNDNLISTTSFVLLFLLIYEVWAALTAGLIYLYSFIPVVWLAYTLMILSFIATHVLLIYVVGKIYLWLPCMQITGFKAFEALRYSQYLVSGMQWKLLVTQLIVLFVAEGLVMACSLLPYGWLFTLILTIVYALVIIIFCVRMMVAYFDRDQIERADLKKY